MWNKVASVVGIAGAVFAVWTRFVLLEARVDYSEGVVVELTQEIKELTKGLQRIEIDLAKKNYCVAQ